MLVSDACHMAVYPFAQRDMSGIQAYGEEMRPVQLRTVVKGYPSAKNDFLFERNLSNHVYALYMEHGNGRPCLVFCRCGHSQCAATMAENEKPLSSWLRSSCACQYQQPRHDFDLRYLFLCALQLPQGHCGHCFKGG